MNGVSSRRKSATFPETTSKFEYTRQLLGAPPQSDTLACSSSNSGVLDRDGWPASAFAWTRPATPREYASAFDPGAESLTVVAAPVGDARASAFMYVRTTLGTLPAVASAVPVVSPTGSAATI